MADDETGPDRADAARQLDGSPGFGDPSDFGLGRLSELADRAQEFSRDPRLGDVLVQLAADPRASRIALTAPREFLADLGIEVPEDLDITFLRNDPRLPPDLTLGKYVPDFEFFEFRRLDCRTYWVAKRDDKGVIVGVESFEVCAGFAVVPKFLPRGPWS